MAEAFICNFTRTPIGRYGGALRDVRTDDLAALPIKALMARNASVDWEALDDCIMGCANQAGEDNRNVARMAVLLAGMPADGLERAAELATQNPYANPRPVEYAGVLQLLRNAWTGNRPA